MTRKPADHYSKRSQRANPNEQATQTKTNPMTYSNDFAALILQSLGEMVFLLDTDLRVRWCSQYAGQLVGSSAEELVGKFCYDLWCQSPRPCSDCPSLRAMKTAQAQRSEIPSADAKIWDVHSYPVWGDAGKIVGATEFRQDITIRKNAQKALSESEERYKVIWDNIDDIIYVISSDRKVVSVNPACEKISGWPAEYWIGKDITPFIHAEDLSKADKQIARFLHGEKVEPTELQILTRTGEYRTIEFKPAALIRNEDVTQITGIGRDVTERVMAGKALQESEEKFRNLTEQSPNMIFINRGGKVVYVNRRCEEVMGYTRDEFCAVDSNFLDLIAPEFVDLALKNYRTHLQGMEVEPHEYALMTKTGKPIETIITTKLINYEGETSILGIVTDITERKEVEKLLHQKDRALMQKTKSLEEMNTALGVLLEQREKEKADFKENIFVNLKKLVFPYIEKLENKKLDEESQTYLNIIRSNLRDLMAPIANTLNLKYIDFTPSEIQVANLITQGKTSKEIASMLNVSAKAVSFHRANIRKKLDLSNKKTNLRSFLQSFPEKERAKYQ